MDIAKGWASTAAAGPFEWHLQKIVLAMSESATLGAASRELSESKGGDAESGIKFHVHDVE